jgi:hypothetical protein
MHRCDLLKAIRRSSALKLARCSDVEQLVQSGFYEVARATARASGFCPATSQNPQDSQISCFLIHHAGWEEASMDGQALLSGSSQACGGRD